MIYRLVTIFLLGFPLLCGAQNFEDLIPEIVNPYFQINNIRTYNIKEYSWKFFYDSKGYLLNTLSVNPQDSSKTIRKFEYDSINRLFIKTYENYDLHTLRSIRKYRFRTQYFDKILKDFSFDFINDLRFRYLFKKENGVDTIYIYKLECLDKLKDNESRPYIFHNLKLENYDLKATATINNLGDSTTINYSYPDQKIPYRYEVYRFNKDKQLISYDKKHSTHTEFHYLTVKDGLVESEIVNVVRSGEKNVYSVSELNYAYNNGLRISQITKTKYNLQGHSTNSGISFEYELNK